MWGLNKPKNDHELDLYKKRYKVSARPTRVRISSTGNSVYLEYSATGQRLLKRDEKSRALTSAIRFAYISHPTHARLLSPRRVGNGR